MSYVELMNTFEEKSLPDLTQVTFAALELFAQNKPKASIKSFKKPLIIGSGNAIATARILYGSTNAVFGDETDYKEKLHLDIDGVLLFSASGGKHAPIIAEAAKKRKKPVQLITCTPNSQAEGVVGEKNAVVTKKNREPYTYNTSTYMGWIFAKTKEDPKKIMQFITTKVAPKIPNNLKSYNGFLLITPDNLAGVNHLFEVKFIELFGRQVARDVKAYEELKHAITVVPNKKELCIQFGKGSVDFENNTLQIPLPKDCGPAALMAIGYYVIGCIQQQKPQYFKNNIHNYIQRNKKGSFGKAMSVIVE